MYGGGLAIFFAKILIKNRREEEKREREGKQREKKEKHKVRQTQKRGEIRMFENKT